MSEPLSQRKPSLFAARLKCVARLNGRKGRKQGLRSRRSKISVPRPAVVSKSKPKRSPTLVPVKRQAVKAKRAVTRVIEIKPKQRRSAVIIRLPVGAARTIALRVARAA